jgi:hypothetical protein
MLGEFFMLQFHRISFINTCALSFSNTHAHAQTPVFMHSRTLTCTHRHAHYTPSSCKAVPYTCHPDLGKSALQNDQVRTCDTRCMSHHTSNVTSCRCNNRNPSIPNILRRSRAWVRVLPFPSLSARHTPHLAPPSSRDTRRTQVCPATRAKHPKWWPSSTISLQTFTSAFARVLSAACVVFFVSRLLHLFSFDSGTDGASVFILQLRRKGKGMLQDCTAAARDALPASQCCCCCFPPTLPPPSPMSSHSSGIRRHDERIADAIEMNGSAYVTCDVRRVTRDV